MQSILIHPVKHMTLYFMGFLYLTTPSILLEVIPVLLINFSATRWFTVCQSNQWWPQLYTIWTHPDLKPSCFHHLPFHSMLGKVLAPSSTFIRKVLTEEDTFFVSPHFELIFLLEMPKITLLATLNPMIHMVERDSNQSLGGNGPSLNLSHYNPRQINPKFPNSFSSRTGLCRQMTAPPNLRQMLLPCVKH